MPSLQELIAIEKTGGQIPQFARIAFQDTPVLDAFSRLRISNPITLFDSRQFMCGQEYY